MIFHIRSLSAVFVSVLLLLFAFWVSGVEDILLRMVGFPPWVGVGIVALLSANLLVVSFRFWRVLGHFGISLPWDIALRASIAGAVAGLFVIPLLGQAMGRQSVLHGFGVQPVVSACLAAYERTLLGLLSGVLGTLGGFYLIGQSVVASFFEQIALVEILVAACGGGALSLWLGRSRFEARLSGRVLSRINFARVMLIAGLTLVGQFLMLGSFVVGILAVSQGIPFTSLLAASALISLAASLPITVGGWGVREIASVYVLGTLGVSEVDALTMSVIVGLCSTLVTVVAAPFYLRKISHV